MVTSVLVLLALVGCGSGGGETPPPEPASSSSLPPRVVVGYWQGWGNPGINLRDTPVQYNVIDAAFAVADGTEAGRVKFDQQVQSQASLITDVDALQRAGRRVVLSVGGSDDGGLDITNGAQAEAFLTSVSQIIDRYHFTGVDWDLEHGIDVPTIADVSRQLKAKYGSRFLIIMAPMQDQPDYEVLAVQIKDILDMVNPQFYDGGQADRTYILDEVRRWVAEVGANRVGMGFMTVREGQATGVESPARVAAVWQAAVRRFPHVRGLMTWSINLDSTSGFRFADVCGSLVLGAALTPPPVETTRAVS